MSYLHLYLHRWYFSNYLVLDGQSFDTAQRLKPACITNGVIYDHVDQFLSDGEVADITQSSHSAVGLLVLILKSRPMLLEDMDVVYLIEFQYERFRSIDITKSSHSARGHKWTVQLIKGRNCMGFIAKYFYHNRSIHRCHIFIFTSTDDIS